MAESHWKAMQSDDYQVFVGVKYLVGVIAAVEQRVKGSTWVRMEARDVPAWDDIVVGDADGAVTHMQVKRQIEPFEEVDFRDEPAKDEKRVTLRNLLAKSRETNVSTAELKLVIFGNPQVRFWRTDGSTNYGELSLYALGRLCEDLRAGGVNAVVPSGERHDWWVRIQKVLGIDAAEAYALLRRFHVDTEGTEEQLEKRLEDQLGNWYANPTSVLNGLLRFARRKNRPGGQLAYGDIYDDVLRDEPRSQNPHGLTVGAHPSGTGLRFAGSTRWRDTPRRGWDESARLDVIDVPGAFGPPYQLVLRAILHWKPGLFHLSHPESWWDGMASTCCTDGLSTDPPDGCAWSPSNSTSLLPTPIDDVTETEFTTAWNDEMDGHVWRGVKEAVRASLPIEGAQRQLWARWYRTIDEAASTQRAAFFTSMLTVASERTDPGFNGLLRVGARSVEALALTLRKALDFAALFDEPNRRVELDLVAGTITFPGVAVRALALRSCSQGQAPSRHVVSVMDAKDDAAGDASVLLLPRVSSAVTTRERWIEPQGSPPDLKDGSRPVLVLTGRDPLSKQGLREHVALRRGLNINDVAARLEEALQP